MKNILNATHFNLLHLERVSRKNIVIGVYEKLEMESGEASRVVSLSQAKKE
jgi:hypothetical protein